MKILCSFSVVDRSRTGCVRTPEKNNSSADRKKFGLIDGLSRHPRFLQTKRG